MVVVMSFSTLPDVQIVLEHVVAPPKPPSLVAMQRDGLEQDMGHGGWLISSSRCMLNLWECNFGGGQQGMPSVMVWSIAGPKAAALRRYTCYGPSVIVTNASLPPSVHPSLPTLPCR